MADLIENVRITVFFQLRFGRFDTEVQQEQKY